MSEMHVVRVHTEPVVLDIGEGTGGLIIYTGEEFRGREIEISKKPDDSARVHTEIAERRCNGQMVFAALYLPLVAGAYTIWGPDPHRPTEVTIVGGAIAEVDWR